jgi:fibronectin type 3 domain-containing protein
VQHEVTLTWSPPASTPIPINAYNVYRSTGGTSSYVLINSTGSTQTTYLDTGVQAATTYAYYVKSVDSAGVESTPSNQVSVNVP